MGTGRVEYIHIAPDSGEPMTAREEIDAVAGRGLRGDRYFEESGLWNELDEEGLADALVHRGGLNARIVESGTIALGDEIQW